MADNQNKEKVAFIKTIGTKYGPMEKLSIELNKIGKVVEKDGRTFLEIPSDCKAFNKYEKDGAAPRFFLNFNLNTFRTAQLDEWEPDANQSNNNSSSPAGNGGDDDDLPF